MKLWFLCIRYIVRQKRDENGTKTLCEPYQNIESYIVLQARNRINGGENYLVVGDTVSVNVGTTVYLKIQSK